MMRKSFDFTFRIFTVVSLLTLIIGSQGVTSARAAGIRYVKPTASGLGDCSSWENACTLITALSSAISGDEIWASAGIYLPTTLSTDRNATFQLIDGVAIYGGFSGTETGREQREPETNLTILSGDIDGNDSQTPIITDITTVTGNSSNSYHIVTGADGAVLDGLTITAGYADGSDPNNKGAGLYLNSSSPTVSNVVFKGNYAVAGAAVYNTFGQPILTDISFIGNNAENVGGGLCNSTGDAVLDRVNFTGNTAQFGAGIYNYNSQPQITNASFIDNTSMEGAGVFNEKSDPYLLNATFSENTATLYGAGMVNSFSDPTLINVTIVGNNAVYGGAMVNSNSFPTLVNLTVVNNTATYESGGLVNTGSNPIIRNSIFWGNATDGQPQIFNADTSKPIVTDCVVQGGYSSGTNIITADPLLGALADNGGLTQTMAISEGSPAKYASSGSCPAIDQRGVPRLRTPDTCDLGAYENATQLFPKGGTSGGGTTVTITGTGFTGGSATFAGVSGVCEVDSDTSITCTSPAHATGAVDVIVYDSGSQVTHTLPYTYYDSPTITNISPTSGVIDGGTEITITGTNLTDAVITFGSLIGTGCSFAGGGATATCYTPAHNAATVKVSAETPGGVFTSPVDFKYYEPPTITLISPNSGLITGGTTIYITGSGFSGITSLTFGGTSVNLGECTLSNKMISCPSPAHAAGTVDVVVTTSEGSVTAVNGFNYYSAEYSLSVTGTYAYTSNSAAISIAEGLTAASNPGGGSIDNAVVLISSGFQTGDTLAATDSGGVTSSYNAATGVLTLVGTADISVYQTVLSSVVFSTTSTNTTPRNITFSLGKALPYPKTGHYFEYVPVALSWANAKTAASQNSFFGNTGYLATVNDAGENGFITTKIGTSGAWIGASDAEVESYWKWETGPEAGSLFCIGQSPCVLRSGWYMNWTPGDAEPDNYAWVEEYAQIVGGGSGYWNDLDGVAGGGAGELAVEGYIVEYGGLPGDGPMSITGSVTVNVSSTGTQTTPEITWTGSTIPYGTLLSGSVLNASAGVTGTFIYNPPVDTLLNAGTHTLHVDFVPDNSTDYTNAAKDVTLTVTKVNPVITFDTAPTPVYLGGNFTVNADTTSTDNTDLLYSVISGPCELLIDNVLAPTGAGTCVIQASGAATLNFNGAAETLNVTIAKANQSALTVQADPTTIVYGNTATLSTSGGDGSGAVTYSAGTSTGCEIAGSTLSVTNASGSCSVTATKAADENYNEITSPAITITLVKANQSPLTVTADPLTVIYGSTSSLGYTGGSGTGIVTYSAGSSTGCTVNGSTLSVIDTSGSCTVTASKAADNNYNLATSSPLAITLSKATAVITFGAAPTPTYLGGNFTVSATTTNTDNSSLVYSVQSGPCTWVSGATFASTGAGTCVVKADGSATTNFTAASQTQNVTIAKADQLELTVSADPTTVVYGNTATLSTSGGSGTGAVTYSVEGSNGCEVTGSTLSVTNASGSCSVTATKAADTNFNAATSSAITITLQKANQAALTVSSDPATVTYGTTASLSTSGGSGSGAVTYSAGESTGCSLVGSTLSVTNASGFCSVTATKAADQNYNAVSSDLLNITLNKAASTTELVSSLNPSDVGENVTFTATVTSDGGTPIGSVTFRDGVATLGTSPLIGGVATLLTTTLPAGTHSITAGYNGNENFTGSQSSVVTQNVALLATTTTVIAVEHNPLTNQYWTLTISVSNLMGMPSRNVLKQIMNATTPTGTVTIKDGATTIGTVALSGGSATFEIHGLSYGVHIITVEYSGDSIYAGSTSDSITLKANFIAYIPMIARP